MTVYSHSRIESFKICPFKYKLSYIDGLDTLPSDEADNPLIVGIALHTGIEQGVEVGIESYKSSYNIMSDEHYNEIIKLESVIPKVEKFINRDRATFEHKLLTDDFVGYVDYIEHIDDKTVKIYDFKYSNNVDRYLDSDQLHLYKYYFEKLNPGVKVAELGFLFVPKVGIKQKKTENIMEFRKRLVTELNKVDVQLVTVEYDANKVINFFENLKHVIEAEDYPKNETNFCRFCNFNNYCQKGVEFELINKKYEN